MPGVVREGVGNRSCSGGDGNTCVDGYGRTDGTDAYPKSCNGCFRVVRKTGTFDCGNLDHVDRFGGILVDYRDNILGFDHWGCDSGIGDH